MLELVQLVPAASASPVAPRYTAVGRAAAFYLLSSGFDVEHVDAPQPDQGVGFLVRQLQGIYGPLTESPEYDEIVARYAIADPNPLALYLRGMALCANDPGLVRRLTPTDVDQAAQDVTFCTVRWNALHYITDTLIRERITAAREARPNTE